MPREQKFLMVSLDDEKSKEIAQVISNSTARKILDYLSENDGSETDISRGLKIPLSTVEYNMKLLYQNNLIESKGFLWSEKGKKIEIYTLARKLIVIAPKGTSNVKKTLKNLLPVTLLSFVASAVIFFVTKSTTQNVQKMTAPLQEAGVSQDLTLQAVESTATIIPQYWAWFLFGAVFALLVYLVWSAIKNKGRNIYI